MRKFVILRASKNQSDLRHTNYIYEAEDTSSFDSVWNSQKSLFSSGDIVTIQDLLTMEYEMYVSW